MLFSQLPYWLSLLFRPAIFINGKEITQEKLQLGDVLRVGNSHLRLQADDGSQPEEAEEEEAKGEEAGEESGPQPAMARFRITRAQAAAFVDRANDLMKGGRPSCPICSRPMDPEGHVCPRSNGHVTH